MLRVGDIEIYRVVEMEIPFLPASELFPEVPHAEFVAECSHIAPEALCADTGKLIFSFHSFVLKTSRHTVLVDTCIGCDKSDDWFPGWHQRRDESWLNRLCETGIEPDNIDYVLCTHLHVDHCGWNTRKVNGEWTPTFPNARYLFCREEYEFAANRGSVSFAENVQPIVDAGQAEFVDTDHRLDDDISLQHLPGHTPGHVAIHLSSQGQRAILFGDVMHSPVQCARPEWHFSSDWKPKLAQETREHFLHEHSNKDVLLLSAHFPSPSIGHIVTAKKNYHFKYREELENDV